GVAEESVRQNFVHPTRIRYVIVEVELRDARQLLPFVEMVQVHFERAFQGASRLHPGSVALVADCHVFEKPPLKFQIRMDIFKLDPSRGSQAVPLALGPLQIHSASASTWAAPSRRTKVRRPECRVQ